MLGYRSLGTTPLGATQLASAPAAGTTWNPADKGSTVTLSGANRYANGSTGFTGARGTTSKSTGKWVVEFDFADLVGSNPAIGLGLAAGDYVFEGNYPGGGASTSACMFWLGSNGNGFVQGVFSVGASCGYANITTGDRYQIAIDFDAGKAWVGKNGVYSYGSPSAGTTPQWTFTLNTTLFPLAELSGNEGKLGLPATQTAALPSGYSSWNDNAAGGASTISGVGASAGVSTPTAVGSTTANIQSGAGASAGVATPTAVGRSVKATVGASAGIATPAAVGGSTRAGAGSAPGIAAVTGVGSFVAQGAGTGLVAASATVQATGRATAAGAGVSAGSSTPAGVGAVANTVASGVGASAGSSTPLATGGRTIAAVGAATASAAVAGAGNGAATYASGVGASAGSSTPAAAGVKIAGGAGSAAGVSTPSGAATGIAPATGVSVAFGAAGGAGLRVITIAGVGLSQGVSLAGASTRARRFAIHSVGSVRADYTPSRPANMPDTRRRTLRYY